MRVVKYNFNGEMQERDVYTKSEVIAEFKVREDDIDGQPFQIEYAIGKMNKRLSRRERLNRLRTVADTLKEVLYDEEYLDIEVSNIAYALWNTVALSDKEVLADKVADNRKLWANVVE